MKKQTLVTLLVIAFVLSFFVTPLGDYSKVMLNRVFATAPTIISPSQRARIPHYDWRLKDSEWRYINFERSRGKVVFLSFWTTWHIPSRAQLQDIQTLYEKYGRQVHFYIVTDEEREPVLEFMEDAPYTFPITYQILGETSPIALLKPPGTYVLDKEGAIAVHQEAIADWDNQKVYGLLDQLLAQAAKAPERTNP
ncbi:TlpA family protein disulfide reductase [Maribacter sp. 2307ULW6-5]|uniref:TlpA family protein disulfide reductase n=1 Tax=Maribacter sp. 2307ULW6-5 TaxID=3386275 RepID=UPI0039BCDF3B